VGRYGLGGEEVVREERVADIKFGVVPQFSAEGGSEKLFTVCSQGGGVHCAKAVVLAVGPGNAPCIPSPFEGIGMKHEAACHALTLRGDCGLPKTLKAKVAAGKRTNVLVLGGGLTSAQVGDLVLKQGVTKVWHLMRGTLKGMLCSRSVC
jgi:cation diffusion facilitator CzcD-associated flavoprotein CzcO